MLTTIPGRHLAVRVFALTLVPLALATVACGGGGGKKVDPEDWVQDVCALATENDETTNDIFAELNDIDLGDEDAKDDVVAAFEEARDSFDDLEDEFNDLGQPDIEQGGEVRNVFRESIRQNKETADRLIDEIRDLDAGRNFEEDLTELFNDFEDEDFDLRAELEDINNRDVDDLIELIEEDPECSAILFDN